MKSKLFLVPIPIAGEALHTLSDEIKNVTLGLRYYFVENVRTARRFLKALHPAIVIDDITFSEIDKHSGPDIPLLKDWLNKGYEIGVMSEAGCPGIADPGSILVQQAHKMNTEVIPLTGPNSIILALMASGLNGQSFAFNGYLPLKDPARSQKLKELEQLSAKERQTQIFIETPYRNNALLEELLKHCRENTLLCIAQDITGKGAFIKTTTVSDWKKNKPVLAKQPAVFLLLA
ncbi:MAG TPA: SAM-dependent methyltransferase [Flavipsychrobacter sp.]